MKFWEFSSAGSEHLPYKQRVTGSNPVTPTKKYKACKISLQAFFVFILKKKKENGAGFINLK